MDKVIVTLGVPGPRRARTAHVELGERAAPPRASTAASREERGARCRYRVDSAYRTYQYDARPETPAEPGIRRSEARKISSADLLTSMIHHMGGAATSHSKGMFVDIAI